MRSLRKSVGMVSSEASLATVRVSAYPIIVRGGRLQARRVRNRIVGQPHVPTRRETKTFISADIVLAADAGGLLPPDFDGQIGCPPDTDLTLPFGYLTQAQIDFYGHLDYVRKFVGVVKPRLHGE